MTLDKAAGRTDDPVRLSKRVAALVPCSRSDAERYIDGGWVRVDGVVVDEPQARVTPGQSVTLDPGASLLALAPLTVLLHQPEDAPPVLPTLENRWPQDARGPRVARSVGRGPPARDRAGEGEGHRRSGRQRRKGRRSRCGPCLTAPSPRRTSGI